MSKPRISSWLNGAPSLKLGDCASIVAAAANIITGTRTLREHRIVYTPISRHPPRLNRIDMNSAAFHLRMAFLGDSPIFIQLSEGRLNFSLIVSTARLDHRLLSIPIPVEIEAGMRLGKNRGLQLRIFPAAAAVSRYLHSAHSA